MTDPDYSVVPTEEQPVEDTNSDDSSHKFAIKSFTTPTYCKFCDRFIFGLYHQGYRCKDCKFATHKRCFEKVTSPCQIPHSEDDQMQTGHNFEIFNFKQPTYCEQCSSFIWGFFHQGYRCHNCKFSTHKRCVGIVGHRCNTTAQVKKER
ncbi:protein kinase C beta type-like [Amphiura filiformis]|uniref:protein kinase C beta type-like n=1 Tax=Amphiura filiformis TaxID=82378 RepID=UPI003B222167